MTGLCPGLAFEVPRDEIDYIGAHDHHRMTWLACAATIIAAPAPLDAVRRCVAVVDTTLP